MGITSSFPSCCRWRARAESREEYALSLRCEGSCSRGTCTPLLKQTPELCFLFYTKEPVEERQRARFDLPPDAAHHLHHPLSPLALAQSQEATPKQKETLVRLHAAGVEAVRRVAAQKRRKCLEKRLRVEAAQKQDERVHRCKAGVQRVGRLEARGFLLRLSRVNKAHAPLA